MGMELTEITARLKAKGTRWQDVGNPRVRNMLKAEYAWEAEKTRREVVAQITPQTYQQAYQQTYQEYQQSKGFNPLGVSLPRDYIWRVWILEGKRIKHGNKISTDGAYGRRSFSD